MRVSESDPQRGVLFFWSRTRGATLFRLRRDALKAIDRTMEYAAARDIGWRREEYRLVKLVEQRKARGSR